MTLYGRTSSIGETAPFERDDAERCDSADCARVVRLLGGGVAPALLMFSICGCPAPPADSPLEDADAIVVDVELVAGGMTSPVAMASPGDGSGRLFIADQIGLIRIIDERGGLLAQPFLDLRDRLVELNQFYDERGLLGLAFHPEYATNGRFFVFYNAPTPEDVADARFDTQARVSEFRRDPDDPLRCDPASERILLDINKSEFHNGGQIAFGPDGLLYIGFGDGGVGGKQSTSTLLGKILRVDVDNGDPYTVPPDNPFVDRPDARPEVWAYGLRNPWRFSFDRDTGRLFVGDVGSLRFEEVSIVAAGANLGWNIREGFACHNPADPGNALQTCPEVGPDGSPLVDPIITYAHRDESGRSVGVSVIGGYVYRGSQVAALKGMYVYGDWSRTGSTPDGALFAAAEQANGVWSTHRLAIASRVSGGIERFVLAFGEGADGELFILTTTNGGPRGQSGEVYRITQP